MKLTGKIILMYLFAMALLTMCYGYSIVIREHARLNELIEEEAESIGIALEQRVISVFEESGHRGLAQLIRTESSRHREIELRWIPLDSNQATSNLEVSVDQLKMMAEHSILNIEAHDFHFTFYPIDVRQKRVGWLQFSRPRTEVDQFTRGTMIQAFVLILGMLLCAGVFTLMGLRSVGGRLEKLMEKTKRIGRGDFSGPLQMRGHDELNDLAEALNEMSQQLTEQHEKVQAESTARLAAVEQLRHVNRLNTVGRLASGVAHELGTPLNVVSGRAELIASGRLDSAQSRESALAIKSEADRMTNIIRQLLDFARRGTPQRRSVDLRPVVDQCATLLRTLATKHHVELVVTGDESMTGNVDAAQIQQVLTNLVVNAIQAMPRGGRVSIDLQHRPAQPPDTAPANKQTYCCISVSDEGEGINESDLQSIFEPFFTTKDVGEGTGLGLAVSYGIVQDHDGWIEVQSEPGKGSCFSVYLPSC